MSISHFQIHLGLRRIMEIVELLHGFWVPNDSHIGKWQKECQKLNHDNWILPQFVEVIQPGWTVFDLGAFNGDHTQQYSIKVGSMGNVVAIEPGRLANKCLEHNVRVFTHANVHCFRGVIDSVSAKFYEHVPEGNLAASRVERSDPSLDSILSITIDDLAYWHKPNFIKLSICGYEHKALLGATETLTQHRPIFAIKIVRSYLAEQGSYPEQIRDLLHQNGYEIRKFIPDHINWQNTPQFDLIAYPK